MYLRVSPTTRLEEMIAVPTSRPATTIRTRDFRRPMFLAARRARSGRNPTTAATRTIPMTIAHADASGRAILSAPRLLDDLAVPHAQHPVRPRAHGGVVGHEDQGLPLFSIQADEEVHDLRRRLRVQVPGRLVRPHDRGVVHERPSDRDALLLSRAQLGRLVVRPSVEFHGRHEGERFPAGLLRGHPRDEERELDVLHGGEDRQQVVRLEDEPHAARPVPALRVVVHRGQGDALDEDIARREVVESGEAIEQGRLPAAGRPHDRDHLAARDREVHPAERVDLDDPGVVHFVGVHSPDDRLGRHAPFSMSRGLFRVSLRLVYSERAMNRFSVQMSSTPADVDSASRRAARSASNALRLSVDISWSSRSYHPYDAANAISSVTSAKRTRKVFVVASRRSKPATPRALRTARGSPSAIASGSVRTSRTASRTWVRSFDGVRVPCFSSRARNAANDGLGSVGHSLKTNRPESFRTRWTSWNTRS